MEESVLFFHAVEYWDPTQEIWFGDMNLYLLDHLSWPVLLNSTEKTDVPGVPASCSPSECDSDGWLLDQLALHTHISKTMPPAGSTGLLPPAKLSALVSCLCLLVFHSSLHQTQTKWSPEHEHMCSHLLLGGWSSPFGTTPPAKNALPVLE